MKKNKIPARFLQFLLLGASAVFTSKTVSADTKKVDDKKSTINDRINLVREHLRNSVNSEELYAMDVNRSIKTPPVDQIWINILPTWNDWNKLWNDWSNWNNWGNFHGDNDHGHDHGHVHDRGHDNDHGRK